MSQTTHSSAGAGQQGPVHLVVMGVSGCGKSTVAAAIAEDFGWPLCEGDDHHPQANVEKMESGEPLTDEDRRPWLLSLAEWTRARDADGESTVLACSALRRRYRDIVRAGGGHTVFLHLAGDRSVLAERTGERDHFMPDSLLDSQLETLEELEPDEVGLVVDVRQAPHDVVSQVREYLER